MKTVVVYDLLVGRGGAERVVLALAKAFNADIWTTTYIPDAIYPDYSSFKIFPHPLKSFPLSSSLKPMNLLWQGLIQTEATFKFRKMELSSYDLIISAGMCAKQVAMRDKNHPCIHYEHGVKESYRLEWLFKMWAWYMKKVDYEATRKADLLVCNSENIRGKIEKYYHRDAEVVYPPVDIKRFKFEDPEDYFLSVQRISPDKGIETQLEAFRMVPQQKLLIIGSPQEGHIAYYQNLIRIASQNVTFLGALSDEEVSGLYSRSKAAIQTNPNEDFGIVPVEAMASGKPCIAVNAGGYRETIVHGKTGILVDIPYPENLAQAIKEFDSFDFDPNVCVERAKLFSEEMFIERMRRIEVQCRR